MTSQTKLLANTICLPVLRDFLEDCVEDKSLVQEAKQRANEVIRSIDRFSKFLMEGVDRETADDTVNFEMWFRNEIIKKMEQ